MCYVHTFKPVDVAGDSTVRCYVIPSGGAIGYTDRRLAPRWGLSGRTDGLRGGGGGMEGFIFSSLNY